MSKYIEASSATTVKFSRIKVGLYRNDGRLGKHTYPFSQEEYIQGVVATDFGFVRVWADSRGYSFDFIWGGNEYSFGCRTDKLLSELTLIRRAKKFATDVVKSACEELVVSDHP